MCICVFDMCVSCSVFGFITPRLNKYYYYYYYYYYCITLHHILGILLF